MRLLAAIVICMLLSSCATIFSRKTYVLKITSISNSDKALINDSIYSLPASVRVKRSKADLNIKYFSDTVVKDIKVKSALSYRFVFGNLAWVYATPVAYLIDLTNQNRFFYGSSIHLNRYNAAQVITPREDKPKAGEYFRSYFSKKYAAQKGQLNLSVSIPFANVFYFKPLSETNKYNAGFGGLSVGLEYFYKNNNYFSVTASGAMDYLVPVPVGVDFEGEHESLASIYLSLSNNHVLNRFHLGYGISFSRNSWHLSSYDSPPSIDPVRKANNSFGLTFNAYQHLSKHFLVGVVYRPTFLVISPATELKYEHLVSLDLRWRFVLKK